MAPCNSRDARVGFSFNGIADLFFEVRFRVVIVLLFKRLSIGIRRRLASTEYRPDCGNRCNQPDDSEGSAYSLPLLCGKPLSEKERHSSAEHGARADGEGKFWKAKVGFFHNNSIRLVREDVKRRQVNFGLWIADRKRIVLSNFAIRN